MSVRFATQKASLHRSARDSAQTPGENFQSTDAQVRLSTVTLPVATVLEFHCCPAVLWSEDRSECVFNRAARELAGVPDRDVSVGADLWLACVDPLDRERFLSAWQSPLSGESTVVCSYRFIPRGTTSRVELEETALRLAAGGSGKAAVLSRYRIRQSRESASTSSLLHQIGNSLQSVRGEVDLLRLFGGLPQASFDTITQAIENIHELTARLDDTDRAKTAGTNNERHSSGRCTREVHNGRA